MRFRGMSIPEVLKSLPKGRGNKLPLVGGLYYWLMIGEVPTREQALEVEAEWAKRSELPDYVYKMLKAMPKDTHPMILFTKRLWLWRDSAFTKKYHEGMKKDAYWEPALEDSMNLTAKLPVIAAFIIAINTLAKRRNPDTIPNWIRREFSRMMGVLIGKVRGTCAFIFHSAFDHESETSAHMPRIWLIISADIYYAFCGMCGLRALYMVLPIKSVLAGCWMCKEIRRCAITR